MNAKAAEALYAAEAAGVKQIKGDFANDDGFCALGLLGYGSGRFLFSELDERYGFHQRPVFTCCLKDFTESGYIAHMNDDHDMTFSEIARKLGPDHA